MLKATNNFVFIIRDKTESERNGIIIPNSGRIKPHEGTIKSVGELVKDPKIRAGKEKKCLFHPTVGFEIKYEETTYVVLLGDEIIAIL